MKIDELKKHVLSMQEDIQTLGNELQSAEHTVDDLESYASSCRENISDCKVSVNNLDDDLEDMQIHLDNLEGFDVDMEGIRTQVKEELILELTNKFGKFIKEALSSDLPTETDNQ